MKLLTKERKEIAVRFLKASLVAVVPIPFVVLALHDLGIEQGTILVVAFLCSVVAIEYFYYRERRSKDIVITQPATDFSMHYSETDALMYGAIAAKIDSSGDSLDLMSSEELSAAALAVYAWSKTK